MSSLKRTSFLSFSRGYIAFHLVLAAVAVLLGIGGFIYQERFDRRAIRTNGTFHSFEGPVLVVTYQDKLGKTHTLRVEDWKSVNSSKPIPVLYDPLKPESARLKASSQAGPFLLILAGILSLSHLPYWEFRLRRWARSNECVLEVVRPVFAWNNPFGVGSTMSDYLITFEVEVTTIRGNRRRAWVKFGSFWWYSLKIETMWEHDEKRLSDILEARRAARPRTPTPLERAAESED